MRCYADYLSHLERHGLLEASLVRQIKPWTAQALCHLFDCYTLPRILEIGRSAGHSFGLLQWLAPDAHVLSVDCTPRPTAAHIAKSLGGFYTFIDLPSDEAFEKHWIHGPFDFVLLDGGHAPRQVASDWENVTKVIEPNAIVMFDNLDMAGCKRVFDAITEEEGRVRKRHLCPPSVWPAGAGGTSGLVFLGDYA
jgi:predicted O-methyltransferase YrrM